jgi:hypothetical protein
VDWKTQTQKDGRTTEIENSQFLHKIYAKCCRNYNVDLLLIYL